MGKNIPTIPTIPTEEVFTQSGRGQFMNVSLSSEQKEIFDAVLASKAQVQTIGGYAGTGKTTLTVAIHEKLGYAVCAPTGKAAHVLRQRGCPGAGTIHGLIYQPIDKSFAVSSAQGRLDALQRRGAVGAELIRALDALREARRPEFRLRDHLQDEDGTSPPGILIDEASMVGPDIFRDLLSFGLPLIFVGDHGQLPPVSAEGEGFNLMAEPMYRLETIHRNAGPIAYFAEHVRKGGAARSFRGNDNALQVLGRGAGTTKLLLSANQVICPFNKSRVECNRKIRASQGRVGLLEPGDRVICLRNDRGEGLFNGMQGTVTRVDERKCVMDFTDDSGLLHADVEFDPDQFGKEKYEYSRGGPHPFDYANVLTCHKAQGSEWPHVLVLDQGWKWEYSRWAYTAASRARERLTWICA
jgi:ATP-dependent exoDNAse (exonuclease V) alpha subunit